MFQLLSGHTKSCAETIDRMINFYEVRDQASIKYLLSALLKLVVSQRLLKGKDGKYEGQDIFSDYINTSNISKYYENTFNTYGITHVILYKNSKLNIFLSRSDRYKELYSDKKFVIYERD
jgi:Tfp pilus assembly pilus retraction ATPase PilT